MCPPPPPSVKTNPKISLIPSKLQKLDKKNKMVPDADASSSSKQNGEDATRDSVEKKGKIHPFLCEVKGPWTELAKSINEINKNKPLIKMTVCI